ncbi:hypothetical protein Aca07nite_65240 [Actinoplanes capillaceus]|uniref:Uncharacterized protein n=1 Tax=Actinoplanes campanulatus TaxID=113559 RepID=A0ABQ3WSK1_9ACTN|nr:hypothetical protein [Actinoplanes capillaceus]GID49249.1 hypothetical protein Aca07nite_65240 [Actinoplanes capillaceus]
MRTLFVVVACGTLVVGLGVFLTIQARRMRANVRIGPGTAPVEPALPSPSASHSPPADGAGDGQTVTRSPASGPVRQVDEVGGDVDVDR